MTLLRKSAYYYDYLHYSPVRLVSVLGAVTVSMVAPPVTPAWDFHVALLNVASRITAFSIVVVLHPANSAIAASAVAIFFISLVPCLVLLDVPYADLEVFNVGND